MMIRQRVLPMLAAILLLGLAPFAVTEAAQGLYSMKALIDAPVYTKDRQQSIGEVDNVLVDEQMKVTGIVVDTDNDIAGLNGHKLFVQSGLFGVQTENGGQMDSVRYRVMVHATVAELGGYPVVDNGWWQTTKQAAVQVWEKTKSTASSVWDATKDATKNVIDTIRDKTR